MNSSRFKKGQLSLLASILCCKPTEIEYLCEHNEEFYGKWVEEKTDKITGKVKTYPNGKPKTRIIRPSHIRLKSIQKSINTNILSKIKLPDNIQGGIKGKSNISNGKRHQGNKYIFATDLQDFFPGITNKQVYQVFLDLGYSNYIANWLTKLTTVDFELPQGSPTSTAIANLVFLKTDFKLIQLIEDYQIDYTRFVDDLTFSSPKDFGFLTKTIIDIITNDKFKISYRKTSYKGDQLLTGINVYNNYIDAPRKIKQKAAEELNAKDSTHKPFTHYLERIRRTNKNLNSNVLNSDD